MPRFNEKPEDLNELLNESKGPLANIAHKSQFLQKLTSIIQQICPDLPQESFRLANITQHSIVIEAKSPAWGQRLQFERNNILRELNSLESFKATQLEIRVTPFGFEAPKKEIKPKKQMSPEVAEQLMQVAESAPKSLREKLEKLAKHAK